jgi:DNA-binding transcriptional LysR family regulator
MAGVAIPSDSVHHTTRVVTPEELAALDHLQWLRTGAAAARALRSSQPTVSRRVSHVLNRFGCSLRRQGGEWRIEGYRELLAAEREVHQIWRLRGGEPLRLEATYWSGPSLATPAPHGWRTGLFDLPGKAIPLRLLRERVIDAWIAGYLPDLPAADDPEFVVVELCHMPCQLQAARNHPLARETGLTPEDLARFPSLALPEGWFPQLETRLKAQHLWNTPSVQFRRYDESSWEGRTADAVTLCYGNALNLEQHPELVQLDWSIGHIGGEALVVRRDLAERSPILLLLEELRRRVRQLADRHAELITLN